MEALEALVVVPQSAEVGPLLDYFKTAGHQVDERQYGRMTGYLVGGLGLCVAVCGHGKTQLALQTQHLIDHCPSTATIVCAGAAGRLVSDLKLGDVVVGTATLEHDYKIRFVERPLPNHSPNPEVLKQFRQIAANAGDSYQICFGPIASGDEDIVDSRRAADLRAETGAVCVAWEGAGAARAAAFSGLRFVEIRGITDGADGAAASDFRSNLRRSMPNVANAILSWAQSAKLGTR